MGHDPNVADDTTEPWNGQHLDLPAHIHVPVLGSPLATSTTVRHTAFEFEFLLNERADHDWVLNRELHLTVPVGRAVRSSPWGLPTAAPEVVLFHKAGGNLTLAEIEARGDRLRPRDEQDFLAVLPTLTGPQRAWLRESIIAVQPGHPWVPHLAS